MIGKSMRRADRRRRSYLARRRKFRLVEDLTGMDLGRDSLCPPHQWLNMSWNEGRRYEELFMGSRADVLAHRRVGSVRRVVSGKPSRGQFDLLEDRFRRWVEGVLFPWVPPQVLRRDCESHEYELYCSRCDEFWCSLYGLRAEWRGLKLSDRRAVRGFLVRVKEHLEVMIALVGGVGLVGQMTVAKLIDRLQDYGEMGISDAYAYVSAGLVDLGAEVIVNSHDSDGKINGEMGISDAYLAVGKVLLD